MNFHNQRIQDLKSYQNETQNAIYPYPKKPEITLQTFRKTFGYLTQGGGQVKETTTLSVVGRIIHKRKCGNKLCFYEIDECGHTVQVLSNFKYYGDKIHFKQINKLLRPGDIIWASGHPGSSNPKGHDPELSIIPLDIVLLSPCLWELPLQNHGFSNIQLRYEKR